MKNKEQTPEVSFLTKVYENAKMGSDSIEILSSKVEDPELRSDLQKQHEEYGKITNGAVAALRNQNELPKETGAISQLGLWSSVQMNTALDKSPDHIAQMMIEGSMMGVIDMTRLMKRSGAVPTDVKALGEDLVKLEENSIQRMKEYLS